ncbi:MAG: chorismate synthase [Oscillospiraceae bacterium]|nr:chorismate synthase [Oscillospiraceae bacterium]
MSSEYGKKLKISVFGQSHGRAIGVTIDGLPTGERIDIDELRIFMARRAPGGALATKRREPDEPVFLSGIEDGVTCGFPVCAIIENKDMRSGDYAGLTQTPRPSHADYTALLRYGDSVDMRGGGHFSGRLTAPLCIAGGIAKQILARRGIYVGAHLASVGCVEDVRFPLEPAKELFDTVAARPLPVIDESKGELMAEEIKAAAEESDSVSGTVECAVIGLAAGLGSPMFDGIENRLAAALFGIPAVKGLEFGSVIPRGSENNDPFVIRDGKVKTETNNCGGILGGITTGMPVVFTVSFKPTPSIGREQRTVDLTAMTETTLTIKGRHDPCVALRAVPVVEAVAATVILDILLEENTDGAF